MLDVGRWTFDVGCSLPPTGMASPPQRIPMPQVLHALHRKIPQPRPANQGGAVFESDSDGLPDIKWRVGETGADAFITVKAGQHFGGAVGRKLKDLAVDPVVAPGIMQGCETGSVAIEQSGHGGTAKKPAAGSEERSVGIGASGTE